MAKKGARQRFGLECSECKTRHYITSKNTVETKEKISLNKYCKGCRKSTSHNEYKLSH